MHFSLTRARLLRAAAGVTAAGSLQLLWPLEALAASEEDVALLRLGASGELLADAFYYRALHGEALRPAERRLIRRARDDDRRHYAALARAIGPDAPAFADFEIGFPRGTFAARPPLFRAGLQIKRTLVGIHLQAAAYLADPDLRTLATRILANEASQLAALSSLAGQTPLAASLPEPLDAERASELLARYWG